jgi:hypothetical protein
MTDVSSLCLAPAVRSRNVTYLCVQGLENEFADAGFNIEIKTFTDFEDAYGLDCAENMVLSNDSHGEDFQTESGMEEQDLEEEWKIHTQSIQFS